LSKRNFYIEIAALTFLFLVWPAFCSDILVPVQRYLVSLRLGDSLEEVQAIYSPKREWPSRREAGTGIVRIDIERSYAKDFPSQVSTLSLGLRTGRLVRIGLIYDEESSRRKPVHELVRELSLVYGEPRRKGISYWWKSSRSVIRVAPVELVSQDKRAKDLRTSIELMEAWVFREMY
jgi:hypothetical protein